MLVYGSVDASSLSSFHGFSDFEKGGSYQDHVVCELYSAHLAPGLRFVSDGGAKSRRVDFERGGRGGDSEE